MGNIVRLERDRSRLDRAVVPGLALSRADLLFVVVVVGASVLASGVITAIMLGPLVQALIPAIVIPTVVSVPATLYLVRQRLRIEALNRQLEELLRRDPLTAVLTRRYVLTAAQGP